MPQAIPYLIAIGKQIALAVAQAAIAYGVTELLGLNDAPEPDSQKFPVKQPIPPVQFAYGEGRLSGPLLYWRTIGNVSIDIIALCDARSGAVEEIESFYLNDDAVAMDGDIVERGADGRYRRDGGENDTIRILSRVGETPSPAYAEVITASGGEWTSAHRADGVATMAIIAKGVKAELTQTIYPNGPVQGSAVGKWLRCYDWRADSTMPGGDGPQRRDNPSTWAWTQNPVVAHVHNEWHVFGQDFDYRFLPTLAQLTVAANVCEQQVPLKAGGTIDRYRVFAVFNSKTPPKQVRQLFTQCYDGLWIERGDGAFVVLAGLYSDPTVVLNEDRIQRFRWRKVRRQEDVCNSLVIAYNSPAHGYTMVETQPWQDAASVAALGEYPQPFELRWVDNNSQARRLAKSAFAKINAEYDGFVDIDLSEDEAELEQRFFRIRNQAAPASMWDVVVLATSMTLDLQNRRVRIEFIKADPTAYDWDAATEEGDGPGVAPTAPPQTIATPVIDSVTVDVAEDAPRLLINLEDPNRPDYSVVLRWSVVGTNDGQITEFPAGVDLTGGLLAVMSSLLPPNVEITFEVAFMSAAGQFGEFTAWPVPVSTALPAAPIADLDFLTSQYRVGIASANSPGGLADWAYTGPAGFAARVDGSLQAYGANVPRISNMGILIEDAATNLLLRSQEFDNASWPKQNSGAGVLPVVTANFGTAPDGTTTADRLQLSLGGSNTLSDTSLLNQFPVAVANGQPYRLSIWAKAAAPCNIVCRHVATGSYTVLAVTTAWQRFTVAETSTSTSATVQIGLRGGTGASLTADVQLWGAQLELGTAPTSYIATAAATASRIPDTPLVTLPAGSGTDVITVSTAAGDTVFNRSALANPNLLDLGNGAWVGQFVTRAVVRAP